jgi:hypothetical protein
LATWIAFSGSSMPTWTCRAEDELLARDEPQRVDQVAVARALDDPLVLHIANGWVPADPIRSPSPAAISRTL